MSVSQLSFKEFSKLFDSQNDLAKEFVDCCKSYMCDEKEKLFKFNDANKLWEQSTQHHFIGDYCDWMKRTQIGFISSGHLAQQELQDFVINITKRVDYNYAGKIYKMSIPKIMVRDLDEKFNSLFPLLIPMNDNKCYDLENKIIIDRTRDHFMTYHYNVCYTANRSEKITNFISQICCGNADMITYLKRILAYYLSGQTDGQIFYIFNGNGANGKSVLLNLMRACMNKAFGAVDKAVMIKEKSSNMANAMYALSKLRLGVFSETNEGEKLNEDNIKKISGCDQVSCKKLYADMGDHNKVLKCKLILCTNKLPHFDATDYALIRRIRLFKFNASFVDNPVKANDYIKDCNLEKTLIEGHLNEFFSWCVDGFILYEANKSFEKDIPAEILAKQDEYIMNENSFKCFVRDTITQTNEDTDHILRSNLYPAYMDYCKENDINIILKKAEILLAAKNILGSESKSSSGKTKGSVVYKSCKWKTEEDS